MSTGTRTGFEPLSPLTRLPTTHLAPPGTRAWKVARRPRDAALAVRIATARLAVAVANRIATLNLATGATEPRPAGRHAAEAPSFRRALEPACQRGHKGWASCAPFAIITRRSSSPHPRRASDFPQVVVYPAVRPWLARRGRKLHPLCSRRPLQGRALRVRGQWGRSAQPPSRRVMPGKFQDKLSRNSCRPSAVRLVVRVWRRSTRSLAISLYC